MAAVRDVRRLGACAVAMLLVGTSARPAVAECIGSASDAAPALETFEARALRPLAGRLEHHQLWRFNGPDGPVDVALTVLEVRRSGRP